MDNYLGNLAVSRGVLCTNGKAVQKMEMKEQNDLPMHEVEAT